MILLLLLTAIGLSTGGSSPTLVKIKITQNNSKNNYKTIKVSIQTEHGKCK
jgi:hypothetical protein